MMERETIESDVLCIGGGIAGLMAAIRASELGAKVVVAEKGNTLHSGAAATGVDHTFCYIPEVQGNIDVLIKSHMRGIGWGSALWRTLLERSYEIVKLWEAWGIECKYQGKYEFAGHSYPVFLSADGCHKNTWTETQADID